MHSLHRSFSFQILEKKLFLQSFGKNLVRAAANPAFQRWKLSLALRLSLAWLRTRNGQGGRIFLQLKLFDALAADTVAVAKFRRHAG